MFRAKISLPITGAAKEQGAVPLKELRLFLELCKLFRMLRYLKKTAPVFSGPFTVNPVQIFNHIAIRVVVARADDPRSEMEHLRAQPAGSTDTRQAQHGQIV